MASRRTRAATVRACGPAPIEVWECCPSHMAMAKAGHALSAVTGVTVAAPGPSPASLAGSSAAAGQRQQEGTAVDGEHGAGDEAVVHQV